MSACALFMGACGGELGDRWMVPEGGVAGAFSSADVNATLDSPVVFNVDCDKYDVAHTLVWALGSSASLLSFNSAAGTLSLSGSSSCLNSGQGPANPPCGSGQGFSLPSQIQVASCSDPSSKGWSAEPAAR